MNEMDEAADAILQAAGHDGSLEELSDVEDGSSSLSEIEDKDVDIEEDAEASDGDNSSEAETERLEQSPNKFRPQQDVLLTAHSQTYERSKLNKQVTEDDEELEDEDEESLSDDDISVNETPQSPKSPEELEPEAPTAATSLQDSSGEGKKTLSIMDPDTKKRKRSIMGGGVFDEDLEEPLRKRTGSVLTPGDDYAIEDEINHEEEVDASNPISGDVSGDEAEPTHIEDVGEDVEEAEEVEDVVAVDEIAPEVPEVLLSPKRRGRKKKKGLENGIENHEDTEMGDAVLNGDLEVRNGDEDQADNEGDDEAEAALKNEEERESKSCNSSNFVILTQTPVEKKRIALDQLTSIERQFATFRDRFVLIKLVMNCTNASADSMTSA
jgi:hypothetical protein